MSVRPSAESYVCHVAEAPVAHPQHQTNATGDAASAVDAFRFPPSNDAAAHRYAPLKADGSTYPTSAATRPGDYPTEEPRYTSGGANKEGAAAITTAVLLAAETHAPSSRSTAAVQPHSRKGTSPSSTNAAAAADPFISAALMDGEAADHVSFPDNPDSRNHEGVPPNAVTNATFAFDAARDAEGLPRRLPAPLEDRVRGYSLMQPSSLTVSQPQIMADGGRVTSSPSATPHGPVGKSASSSALNSEGPRSLPPAARNAATGLPKSRASPETAAASLESGRAAAATGSPVESGALVASEGRGGASVVTDSRAEAAAMKDLVSHVDRTSFGFDLRDALQSIDFAAVLQEYHHRGSVESAALQDCRHLFRVIAKNKDAVSAEDIYDLLVLFTPCGATFREGVDFLWENCERKLSLSFESFLQYGPRLRARLRGYELFSQLSDHDRILVTHHRVLPDVPLGEANDARVRLLQLADEQLEGALRPNTRPLRLYEELFLVEYQEMLYDAALIPASEVPRRVAGGDFAHEQNRTLPRLSVPVLQKESTDWRSGGAGDYGSEDHYAAASGEGGAENHRRPYPVAYCESAASGQISPVHRDANYGAGTVPLTAQQQRLAQSKRAAATARTANACYGAYSSGGSRSARDKEALAVTLQGRPRPEMRKNLGRFVEEEYWERRTLDDHLITQLQTMYSHK